MKEDEDVEQCGGGKYEEMLMEQKIAFANEKTWNDPWLSQKEASEMVVESGS